MKRINNKKVVESEGKGELSISIALFSFIAFIVGLVFFLSSGYVANNPKEVSKKLESDFIYSPVKILASEGKYRYHLHLYSYEETKEIKRYGISQSHKLIGGDEVEPRKLIEGRDILNGISLIKDSDVIALGGYNPDIATSVIVEIENKSLDKTWRREFDLPKESHFLLTKEVPFDFAGIEPKTTYMNKDRENVTEKVMKANQINE